MKLGFFVWLFLVIESLCEQLEPELFGEELLGFLIHGLLSLLGHQLLFNLLLECLRINDIVVFLVVPVVFNSLDSALYVTLQVFSLDLLPSVSVVSDCAQCELLLILSELTVLAHGVQAHHELDLLSEEGLGSDLIPTLLLLVISVVLLVALFFVEFLIILPFFVVLFSLSMFHINVIFDCSI